MALAETFAARSRRTGAGRRQQRLDSGSGRQPVAATLQTIQAARALALVGRTAAIDVLGAGPRTAGLLRLYRPRARGLAKGLTGGVELERAEQQRRDQQELRDAGAQAVSATWTSPHHGCGAYTTDAGDVRP